LEEGIKYITEVVRK